MFALQLRQMHGPADLAPFQSSTPPEDGDSLAHALIWLARQPRTGVLRIHREDGLVCTWNLLEGNLQAVAAEGWSESEGFLARVEKEATLTGGQVAAVRAQAAVEGKPATLIAYRAGLISIQDVVRLIRDARGDLLARTLDAGSMTLRFEERDEVPKDAVSIPFAQTLFGVLRRSLEGSTVRQLEERLGDCLHRFPQQTFEAAIFLRGRDLEFAEGFCTGNLNARVVIERGNLGPLQGGKLLLLMHAFGLIEARRETLHRSMNQDVREAVDARLSAVESDNHFDVLDVHWTAHVDDIRAKYDEEVKRFDEYLARPDMDEDLAEDVRLIRLAMDEALRRLMSASYRKNYRQERYGARQIIFSGVFLHQQAELAIFREDYREARKLLEAAIDLTSDPKYSDAMKALGERVTRARAALHKTRSGH